MKSTAEIHVFILICFLYFQFFSIDPLLAINQLFFLNNWIWYLLILYGFNKYKVLCNWRVLWNANKYLFLCHCFHCKLCRIYFNLFLCSLCNDFRLFPITYVIHIRFLWSSCIKLCQSDLLEVLIHQVLSKCKDFISVCFPSFKKALELLIYLQSSDVL